MTEQVSYLGPENSYSHQAAIAITADRLEHQLISCPNITSVFSSHSTYAVIPISNTIHGPVQESLLNLSSLETKGDIEGRQWRIIKSYELRVQHNLVVRRGTQLANVEWVASHEQALGQCSNYLSKILPNARRVAFPSTAHAATYLAAGLSSNITSAVSEQARVKLKEEGSLIREDGERPSGIGAAICSSAIAEQFKDSLEVVDTGIQNIKENYTRFLLMTRVPSSNRASLIRSEISQAVTSTFLWVSSPSELHPLGPENQVLAVHDLPVRPDLSIKRDTSIPVAEPEPRQKKKYGRRGDGKAYLVEVQGEVRDHPESGWLVLGYT